MSHEERLRAGLAAADVADIAGRIIADPTRSMVSLADKLALALAYERAWAVCLEADLLVRWLTSPESERRTARIQDQVDILRPLLAGAIGRRSTPPTPQKQES